MDNEMFIDRQVVFIFCSRYLRYISFWTMILNLKEGAFRSNSMNKLILIISLCFVCDKKSARVRCLSLIKNRTFAPIFSRRCLRHKIGRFNRFNKRVTPLASHSCSGSSRYAIGRWQISRRCFYVVNSVCIFFRRATSSFINHFNMKRGPCDVKN